jgi:hypothetical protein
MSSDDYFIIRKHPLGGFAAVRGFASDDGPTPEATEAHQQYPRPIEAVHAAMEEGSEYGVRLSLELITMKGEK